MIYAHYGDTEYRPELFQPIQNREMVVKPHGGLWASIVGAEYSWKEWCEDNSFHTEELEKCFLFELEEAANILTIRSTQQLDGLPKAEQLFDPRMAELTGWVFLDFEKLARDGVDAITVDISGDGSRYRVSEGLYWKLYGWDCDSTIILNKEVIRPCMSG